MSMYVCGCEFEFEYEDESEYTREVSVYLGNRERDLFTGRYGMVWYG